MHLTSSTAATNFRFPGIWQAQASTHGKPAGRAIWSKAAAHGHGSCCSLGGSSETSSRSGRSCHVMGGGPPEGRPVLGARKFFGLSVPPQRSEGLR
ncbi:hypothetical protein WJX84_009489 [Apatococcus fuscideae]|uniref:Uncharacterized protein n=1 Tax=Apatococcus fuscideae TaxID=2026836 RepID=A0AAW1SU25_9CHLO